jgi:hypothetical protein
VVFSLLPGGDKALIEQQKKGRPRSKSPMVHTAIVLPRDLLERLREDAKRSNQGLSAYIREHLWLADFRPLQNPYDKTTELVAAIKRLADTLAQDLGKKWHQHPYVLAAFKAGVAAFLARYQLEGDESVRPDTRGAGEPDDPPDVVGRTHARLIEIAIREDEERRPSPDDVDRT